MKLILSTLVLVAVGLTLTSALPAAHPDSAESAIVIRPLTPQKPVETLSALLPKVQDFLSATLGTNLKGLRSDLIRNSDDLIALIEAVLKYLSELDLQPILELIFNFEVLDLILNTDFGQAILDVFEIIMFFANWENIHCGGYPYLCETVLAVIVAFIRMGVQGVIALILAISGFNPVGLPLALYATLIYDAGWSAVWQILKLLRSSGFVRDLTSLLSDVQAKAVKIVTPYLDALKKALEDGKITALEELRLNTLAVLALPKLTILLTTAGAELTRILEGGVFGQIEEILKRLGEEIKEILAFTNETGLE